jgi:hypothetical protein
MLYIYIYVYKTDNLIRSVHEGFLFSNDPFSA